MRQTLWSKGQLLGSISALPEVAASPGFASTAIVGCFEPTPDLKRLAAPLVMMAELSTREQAQAFGAVRLPESSELAGVPQVEAARMTRDALRTAVASKPDFQRIMALQESIDALALELRDVDGAAIAANNIRLMSVETESGIMSQGLLEDVGAEGMQYVLIAQRVDAASTGRK
jgi:CRP-like cAMP-binding protein